MQSQGYTVQLLRVLLQLSWAGAGWQTAMLLWAKVDPLQKEDSEATEEKPEAIAPCQQALKHSEPVFLGVDVNVEVTEKEKWTLYLRGSGEGKGEER